MAARYATDLCEFTLFPQVAVPASSGAPVASVSPPLHDAMDTGRALMEVMKETAVGCNEGLRAN